MDHVDKGVPKPFGRVKLSRRPEEGAAPTKGLLPKKKRAKPATGG